MPPIPISLYTELTNAHACFACLKTRVDGHCPHPNHPVAPAPGDFSFRIMRGSCTPNSSTVYSRCSCIRQGRLCQGLLSDSPYSRKPKEQHTIPRKFRYNKYAPFSRFHDWYQLPRYSCNAMSCSYGVPAVAVNAPVFCPVPWRKRE